MHKTIDAKDKPGTRVRGDRIRFLNVIYFVDSHRTRSLKFTIRTATISLAVLLSLLAWSFIASGLLAREYAVNSELRAHSRKLLSSIFSYQTRFDEVYEKAYPSGSVPSVAQAGGESSESSSRSAEASAHSDVIVDTDGEVVARVNDSSNDEPSAKAKAIMRLAAKTPPAAEASGESKDVPIEIEKFSMAMEQNILVIRFALKNLSTPNKISGTVSARAKFAEAGGATTIVEMSDGDTDDESGGDNADHSSGQHFNIRFYKKKIFRFAKPGTDKSGYFSSIEVALKDEKGRSKTFDFPLNQKDQMKGQESVEAKEAAPADTDGADAKGPYAKSIPDVP